MAIAFVQSTKGRTTGFSNAASMTTATFASSPIGGNSIIVGIGYHTASGDNISSVTDTASNTYTKVLSYQRDGTIGSLDIWYANNITSGSNFTVTANFSSSDTGRIIAQEFSGVALSSPLDVAGGSTFSNSSGSTATSNNITTTSDSDLFILLGSFVSSGTYTAGTGFSNIDSDATNILWTSSIGMESKITGIAGSYNGTIINSNLAAWFVTSATFKAASGVTDLSVSVSDSITLTESTNTTVSALPAVVQSAQLIVSDDNTGTISFDNAPGVGSLLLFGVSYFDALTLTKPTGLTQIDDLGFNSNAHLWTGYRVVQSGDSNSFNFSTDSADWWSVVAVEITGQATSGFINTHSINGEQDTSTTTTDVTPSVLSTLPIGFFAQDEGSAIDAAAAGWSVDENPVSDFNPAALIHRTTNTADTTTPVDYTFTVTGSTTDRVVSMILVGPTSPPNSLSVGVSDAITASESIGRTEVDNATVSDSTSVIDYPHYYSDLIATREQISVQIQGAPTTLSIAVSDTATLSETVRGLIPTLLITTSDNSGVTDSITVAEGAQAALSIHTSDSITVGESFAQQLAININKSDTVSHSESVGRLLQSSISRSDAITITESVAAKLPFLTINLNDSATITEVVTVPQLNAPTRNVTITLASYDIVVQLDQNIEIELFSAPELVVGLSPTPALTLNLSEPILELDLNEPQITANLSS